MTDRFARALPLVLAAEGGFVDHPRDPGGRTNMGITQRAYDEWQAYIGADRRDVIDITAREVDQIYRVRYWDAVRGDALPAGLAYVVFDAGVNSGPARAVKWLQAAVGVAVDGICGPQTLAAVQTCDTAAAIRAICAARLAYCRQLATWSDFGSGWTARISRVEADALKFAAGVTPDPVASPLPMGRSRRRARRWQRAPRHGLASDLLSLAARRSPMARGRCNGPLRRWSCSARYAGRWSCYSAP
jgi:lysozyme family protein